ncbi:MAG: acyl carrier protein [Gemmatimonadetes bacterium]|nr:acyl carrier protein [Gemmatimonadota bacterium]
MTIQEIRRFIQVELMNDPSAQVADDEDLLLSGRLDSLGVMRLVAHLQEALGMEIPPEDVVLENFGSLRRIQTYVATVTSQHEATQLRP